MATLNNETIKMYRRKKIKVYAAIAIIIFVFSPLIIEGIDSILSGILQDFGNVQFDFNYAENLSSLIHEPKRKMLFVIMVLLLACFFAWEFTMTMPRITETATREVASGVTIPVAVGNGQYGNADFLKKSELEKLFMKAEYSGTGRMDGLSKKAGLIVSFEKIGKKEIYLYLAIPVHAIILGATRIGKTRRILLTSTWLNIFAGINMCITDVKGEIYAYTVEFARKNDYRVLTFDLSEPEKSDHHNYMVEIINYLKEGDVTEAVDKTWDLVSVLVGEAKGEKIWNDGECATIAAIILIVAQDAPEECKNLTNVYLFLAYMCESDAMGEMPINNYLQRLPSNHPARAVFQVAKIAPVRTRSSFFTSALGTLRLFTNYKVAEMTSKSDYLMSEFDDRKTILYLIVPDEKKTRYSLASLYINQLYIALTGVAKKKGGSLDRKFVFRCDEVGNFPYIPCLGGGMSAAAGRNIFFELVLQDYQQLESKYKEEYGNIKANAQLTMYLRSTDSKTLKELSDRCGSYTVQLNSASTSQGDKKVNSTNYSTSANLGGRPLLYPNDIEKFKSPDVLLFMGGENPAITKMPDLSCYYANKELGLGDEEYNRKVYVERHAARESRFVREPVSWGIWDAYENVSEMEEVVEKVSFM